MRLTGTPGWLTGRSRQEAADSSLDPPEGTSAPARVWAIGGGKGGVGKSFVAVNMATVAAESGKSVLLIDADLGGANLHTCLGVTPGDQLNLSDFLEERVLDLLRVELELAMQQTGVPSLSGIGRRFVGSS